MSDTATPALLGVIATLNAVISVLAALLGIAPFTPAVVLFLFTLPLAAWVAGHGRAVAAGVVVAGAVLAFVGSPFHGGNPVSLGSAICLAWVAWWASRIVVNLRRFRAARASDDPSPAAGNRS